MARWWLRAVAIWLAILLLAIGNGLLRESVLIPNLGRTAGLVASGLLLSALVALVALASIRWLRPATMREAWQQRLLWLVLTLVFEFGFGRWRGKPWSELLEAYTFSGGNIWPLVLLVIVVAPPIAWRLRGRRIPRSW
jgi:hypothetical protein